MCPVRPSEIVVQADDDEAWEDVANAPDALDSDARDVVNLDDRVDGDSGVVVRRPRGFQNLLSRRLNREHNTT